MVGKINAIDNQTAQLTVDPELDGDSFIQFDINSVNEFRTGVEDLSSFFKLSQGSSLGTNDICIMRPTGECSLPLQPAFAAALTSPTSNDKTGDGTIFTLVADDIEYNRGGAYVPGNFTAPVTGDYYLQINIMVQNLNNSHDLYRQSVNTSNRVIVLTSADIQKGKSFLVLSYCGSTIAEMDAGDSGSFEIQVSGSTKTVGVSAGSFTTISACLLN